MALVYHSSLGHHVRDEPVLQHGRSSYALAQDALERGDFTRAADYGAITVQEATEAYELYTTWLAQIPDILADNGIAAGIDVGIETLDAGWACYRRLVDDFVAACAAADAATAGALLERARSSWQHSHDRATDTLCALLGLAAADLGEAAIGALWDTLLAPIYERSARIYHPDAMPWGDAVQRLLLDIFEATRGHLTGPRRDGGFSIVEEETRWVITFAPCGSGGRTYEGPRPAVTTEQHDWAWNTTGVCLYCAHCCQLQQRAPIARLGFPLRVIDPPTTAQPRPVCTWSIYKDRTYVPDEAYTRVGFPAPDGR